MGWTGCNVATKYNPRSRRYTIDRKAECDKLFNDDMVSWENNEKIGKFEVLKSAMVGSTYYAAVKRTKFATETEPENSIVFAAIVLTNTNVKDYWNFHYKDMDETCGPYQCDCPKGILDLLTPTENEYANQWRAACRENLSKKNNPNALNKLPLGSVIKFTLQCDTTFNKAGSEITLEKTNEWSKRAYWMQHGRWIKWPSKLVNSMTDGNYEVVRRGKAI